MRRAGADLGLAGGVGEQEAVDLDVGGRRDDVEAVGAGDRDAADVCATMRIGFSRLPCAG